MFTIKGQRKPTRQLPLDATNAKNGSRRKRNNHSIASLVVGTVIAQIIATSAAPFLTRIYSPSDLGVLAVYTSLLTLLGVVVTGRYEMAVTLPKEESEAKAVLTLAAICTLASSSILALPLVLCSEQIAGYLRTPEIAAYLWTLPVGVMLSGLLATFLMWSTRHKAFNNIAGSRIGQSVGTSAVQLASSSLGALGLVTGFVVGQAVGLAQLIAMPRRKRPRTKMASLRTTAKRYRDFPIYSTWTALLNTAGAQFAPLIFAGLFGTTTAGLYALTLRVLAAPAALVGSAVGTVFLSQAPEERRRGRLADVVGRLHLQLAILGVPALLLILVAGPSLFALLFGEQWRTAGTYAQWMAPWIYLQFQWTPLSTLSTVLELQRQALVAQATGFALRAGGLAVCLALNASVSTALITFSVSSAIVYGFIQLWFMRRAGLSPWKVVKRDIRALLIFTARCAPSILLFISGNVWCISIAAVLFTLVTMHWYSKLRTNGVSLP